MTRRESAARHAKRERILAENLYNEIKAQRETVWVRSLLHRFHGSAAFTRLSLLHRFLSQLPLNLKREGAGKGRANEIIIDNASMYYVAHKLGIHIATVSALQSSPQNDARGHISPAMLHRMSEAIPDFAPMGDPIFTLHIPR